MSCVIQEEQQREISRLVVKTGQMLLQHGAESSMVNSLSCRLGRAMGLHSVEISLSASSMVVTTLVDGFCVTTARRCPDRGINMHVVSEIQQLVIAAEQQRLSAGQVKQRLESIEPYKHNRWLVIVMIGLSCASFCRLAGGDWLLFAWTFVASAAGMFVRQEIAHRHFNPLLNFGLTAFVTSLIAAQAELFQFGNNPTLAMASSVLMLVPGFPLINAISDMVNGYVNMGIARWIFATLLGLATSIGIITATTFTGVWTWL
ncbi:threonine/serine ThrE exporter family protein [Agaribacterium haliotis]|uniref:threonine/serine ThrE exporter family protein n=1 Tax=Agaribacterium haliotis TaxID=2013869 RepID=UPI000BB547F4|nr:threonine/serine exporter family protein [Agaribacterium haliotis]